MSSQPEDVPMFRNPEVVLSMAIMARAVMDLYFFAAMASRARADWLRPAAFWSAMEVAAFFDGGWAEALADAFNGMRILSAVQSALGTAGLRPVDPILRGSSAMSMKERAMRMSVVVLHLARSFPALPRTVAEANTSEDRDERSSDVMRLCQIVRRRAARAGLPDSAALSLVDRAGRLAACTITGLIPFGSHVFSIHSRRSVFHATITIRPPGPNMTSLIFDVQISRKGG